MDSRWEKQDAGSTAPVSPVREWGICPNIKKSKFNRTYIWLLKIQTLKKDMFSEKITSILPFALILSVFAYPWLLVETFTTQESTCEKINGNEFYTNELNRNQQLPYFLI